MADLHGSKVAKDVRKGAKNSITPANHSQSGDVVKASDFNFITVLGKGSFGKVQRP